MHTPQATVHSSLVADAWLAWHSMQRSIIWLRHIAQLSTTISENQRIRKLLSLLSWRLYNTNDYNPYPRPIMPLHSTEINITVIFNYMTNNKCTCIQTNKEWQSVNKVRNHIWMSWNDVVSIISYSYNPLMYFHSPSSLRNAFSRLFHCWRLANHTHHRRFPWLSPYLNFGA